MSAVRLCLRVLNAAWLVLVLAVAAVLLVLSAEGWRLEVIQSGSMAPSVPTGSLAVIEPIDDMRAGQLQVGDVITFPHRSAPRLVLHRIVEVTEDDADVSYRTQGDANRTLDPLPVGSADVEGILRWSRPGLGSTVLSLAPPNGLMLWLGVPALLWLVERAIQRRPRTESDDGAGAPGPTGTEHDPATTEVAP